jgi:predicted enzyme involved in methoxymalonyl-ACP biosynthesis
MASGADVLNMLLPKGQFIITGNDYDSIQWFDNNKITKEQFEAGFAQWEVWKVEQDAQTVAKKAAAEAKLAALGLTADDLKALGLGNN